MTVHVGPKGQVVIPKEVRDQLDIRPGDEVAVWREDDHVVVRSVRATQPLLGRFVRSDLTGALLEERRRDRRREDYEE